LFYLRSIQTSDLPAILALSKLVYFINLPREEKLINDKIKKSENSFKNPFPELYKNYYMFVLEDIETRKIVGVSMIHAQHGTKEEPHFYLQVSHEKKYSKTINTGFIHGTLKLGYDMDGPTEIGALVIDPAFRGHTEKLGKQLSFVRFLYMSTYPERFKPLIHAELMPPLDEKGNSPLWEAIGRQFINMDYQDADRLSLTNKEFILNLFPSDTIYETLLPIEARNAIGKVGADTLPVKNMLEKIGFTYQDQVDPFDGGPHFRCPLVETKLYKEMFQAKVVSAEHFDKKTCKEYLISFSHYNYDFCAVKAEVNVIDNGKDIEIVPSESLLNDFPDMIGQKVNLIPFNV
jgi:arginine N-succinyltransferase